MTNFVLKLESRIRSHFLQPQCKIFTVSDQREVEDVPGLCNAASADSKLAEQARWGSDITA